MPAHADAPAASSVLCVDVGSTFTKAVLVDVATGDVLGTASHPTTVATDVMDGVDAVRASLAAHGEPGDVLVCSSAGEGCAWPWSATSAR